jgi:hypothetical protein
MLKLLWTTFVTGSQKTATVPHPNENRYISSMFMVSIAIAANWLPINGRKAAGERVARAIA